MPNFAFNYCVRQVRDADIVSVNLSGWRLLINGTERVRAQNLDALVRRFHLYGLNPLALRVGYGMAECVLGVIRTAPGERTRVDWIDAAASPNRSVTVPCTLDHRSRTVSGILRPATPDGAGPY